MDGKCSACGEWNTIVEEVLVVDKSKKSTLPNKETKAILLSEVDTEQSPRIDALDTEFNRVLGGGIVPGSIVLLGGEPGIGKSTLMLQIALKMKKLKILYISGEESHQQIKLRADRLRLDNENLYIYSETSTQNIHQQIELIKPDLVVVDSIQTATTPFIESSAGSISQVRESAAEINRFAKEYNIPVIIIGHITKDGSIA